MPRSRILTPAVCLIAALVLLGLFFLANAGQAASDTTAQPAEGTAASDQTDKAKISEAYGKLPMSFVANEGQTDERVKFMSRGRGYSLYLTANEAVLVLTRVKGKSAAASKPAAAPAAKPSPAARPTTAPSPRPTPEKTRRVLRMELVGANSEPRVAGVDELPGKFNYLVGNDESRWRTNLPTFARVEYKEVYPGIGLVYYGNQQQLEYDFVLSPGAKPEAIKLQFTGADDLKLSDKGDLLIKVAGEVVTMHKPFAYQTAADGRQREVQGSYVLKPGGQVVFEVKKFDKSKTLVIDPVIAYSTEIGSGGNEYATSIAVDAAGNAYITGNTESSNYPTTPGSLEPESEIFYGEAFVTKLNAAGTALVYSTFLGGNGNDAGSGIDVDSTGNAYVTGQTNSSNFPAVNAIRGPGGNLLKSGDGGAHWSDKNVGTPPGDIRVLAVDPTNPNTIYAGGGWSKGGGIYKSIDGGNTWNAVNTGLANASCMALVINPKTPSMLYAALTPNDFSTSGIYKSTDGGNSWTSLTGTNDFRASALAIDPKTPTTLYAGAYFDFYKSTDGGATWKPSGNGMNYAGHRAIVINPVNPAIIYVAAGGGGVFKSANAGASWAQVNTGLTSTNVLSLAMNPSTPSTLFAGTTNGVFKSANSGSSWVAVNTGLPSFTHAYSLVMDPAAPTTLYFGTANGKVYKTTTAGSSWSKVYETLSTTSINAVALDPTASAKVYAGGSTNSESTLDDYEVFVSKLNASGSALVYSTYLGGEDDDHGYAIAVDGGGSAYVTGQTSSPNFTLKNAYQATNKGGTEVFVTKLNPAGTLGYSTFIGGQYFDRGNGIAVDASGYAYVTGLALSDNFPSVNPITNAAGDAFVAKLNQAGNALVYSTRLNAIEGQGIAVDVSGNAHVTGSADWSFRTTPGAFQTENGGNYDAYLVKINPAGNDFVYATYLGGDNDDAGHSVALDSSGNAHVIGHTDSADYPLAAGALRTKSPLFKSTDAGGNWDNNTFGLKGGVVLALAIDPQIPSTLYAGTQTGGFKSTDGGNNWKQFNSGQVMAIVVDPVTPSTIYMAGDSPSGTGVLKSTDGGESWTMMKNGLSYYFPLSLAIDPATPTTLYLGTSGGPIYKTVNGAATWKQSSSPTTLNEVVSLSISPAQPTTVYAAARMPSAGIFKSTNAGGTWSRLAPTQLGVGEYVAVSATDPSVVFATAGNNLYKSTNGGTSWTLARTPGGEVVIDPTNPSHVYLLTAETGILKSTDGGANWRPINKGLRYTGATTLLVNPSKPSTVYVGVQTDFYTQDIFVTKVNPTGNALVYSTLLASGYGSGIAVDAKGNTYLTGQTGSDFPVTPNSFQPFNVGGQDVFITKLGMSYSIKGQALNADGSPLSGVEVTLGGAQLKSVLTEFDGSYIFPNLPGGASFTVSAAKASYSFTPAGQSFTNLNGDKTVNFKAAASSSAFYTIGGRVTNNGGSLVGVQVKLSGSQTRVATTDSNGNYSFTVPGAGSYTVTPAVLGFNFTPATKTFSGLNANQTADFAAGRLNFVVTNTNDHGPGSLWQAVADANASPGADTITFKIPGTGFKTIATRVALPEITEAVTIDGTTQPGFAGAPIIVLDGSAVSGGSGLRLVAGNCTIRGLVIHSFEDQGIRIDSSGNTIQGNYVGLDPTGKQPRPNHDGITVFGSSNNTIGGTTAAARNVISGNRFAGISVGNAWDNLIQGNFVGTDAAGTAPIGNGTYGIEIFRSVGGNPPTGNLIGGTAPGAGNLISGNQTGIDIGQPGTTVQGNLVGTDATGMKKLGNGVGIRITIYVNPADTLVGGTAPGARNVISGNTQGVYIGGTGSKLQGNFVGTDITGMTALGNEGGGVVAGDDALVGGTTPEARNIISGNGGWNVALGYNGPGNKATVQGNYIGTDLTGNVALNNPGHGIVIYSSDNVIGGLTPSARNIISGNQTGIHTGGYTTATVTRNVIQGNYIGLNAAGKEPLPNKVAGITLSGAADNIIGGTQDAAGNVIAFNRAAGIVGSEGAGNLISHNSIFSNAKLGIDLGTNGPTQNDAGDGDEGSNNLQNFPVLTSVTSDGVNTTVKGSLKSKPSTTYTIDFYLNTACDASGYGEGARFFSSKKLVTDANGNAVINLVIPKPLPAGKTIAATATDPAGSTSEFSPCDPSAATGSVEFSVASFNVLEDIGSATITVVRSGGSKGSLTVKYATSDLTAKAGSDYTAAAGTLVFADGETSKTFNIAVANDNVTEPDELVQLTLSGLTDLETRGAYTTAVMRIQGNNTQLTVIGEPVTVVEGDSGTTDAVVTVTLSAATSRTITVPYATSDVYFGIMPATSGTDYQPLSGTLTFGPGVTSQTITVQVNGDTIDELTEGFAVVLSDTPDVSALDYSYVFITDDEADPQISIADASVVEGNPGEYATATFKVQLSRPSDFYVQVSYRLEFGTAQYNDYASYNSETLYIPPGQTSVNVNVPIFGDAEDEPNETFFVHLNTPGNATFSDDLAVGTIMDNDPTTVSITDVVNVTEGNAGSANASFKVTLSLPSAQPVTVKYATANQSAAAGTDYTHTSGTLTFAPGQTVANVNVPVTGDLADEENEQFTVNLSAPTNAVLGYYKQGTCVIADNDAPPKVSINNVTVTEGNAGTVNAAFTVSLSAASGQTIYVNYETADATATDYLDYTQVPMSLLTFTPGQTSKTVSVAVKGDTSDEPDAETFKVLLSNPNNATLGTAQGIGTIKDDDATPQFKVSDVVVTEGDSGTTAATFTITLVGQTQQNVSVKFATSDGTALAASDYTAKPLTTLSFLPGAYVKDVTVYVKGDKLDEANETFNLTLSAATNATIQDGVGVGTITDNDGAADAQAAKTEQTTTAKVAASTVEFAEAVYSVGEGDGRLDVAVRRGGDLSRPLAVEYATADATASDRSDYAAAIGRLSFAPGEDSKSFTVFITDDAYAEGEESLQLSLSVIEGTAAPGGNSTAEVKLADNDNAEGAVNPLDDAQFFVRQQFVDILGRDPEPDELFALVKKLNECPAGDATCTRESVSASLLLSDEHQNNAQLIYGLYKAALGRAPEYREFVRELHEIASDQQSGVEQTDEDRKARVREYVAQWLAATERQARKTDREFVNSVVGNAGLKPAAGSALLGGLTRKEKTRAEVLLDVLGVTEVKDKWRNETLVLAHYFTYLRREPDADGYGHWLEEAKKVPMSLISGFVNSAEYRQRFGRP